MAIPTRWRQRWAADSFSRDSALLFFSTQIGNAANLLFQWTMFRRLPAAEYAALMAVTGISLSLALPLEALRAAVARQSALAVSSGAHRAELRRMLARWTFGLTAAAAIVVAFGGLFAGGLCAAWSPADRALALIGAAAIAVSLYLPLLNGMLQGLRRFGWFAAIGPAFGIGRVAAAALFVRGISATAPPAAAGHAVGAAFAVLLGALGVRAVLGRADGGARANGPVAADAGYFLRGLPSLLAFGILMNADAPLAKLALHPDPAGAFARAATIARAIVFLPMPIALAVFPRIAARAAAADRRRLERRAALATGAVGLAAAPALLLLAAPLWRFFSGRAPTAAEANLVRVLAVAMAPLGVVWLQLNVLLARGRWRAALWLVAPAAVYLAAALRAGTTPMRIAAALGAAAWTSWPALALAGARRPESH